MHNSPLVSIAVPVYNGENYLAPTLDSLINQTYENIEIIISDNGSTDSTKEICESFAAKDKRIKYFRYDANKGAAWNFNNAFKKATGAYFKWAAHDDLHAPEFVAECVGILESKPEVVLCFSRTNFIDSDGNIMFECKYETDLYTASRRERFIHFANADHIVHEIFGVIRKEALDNSPLIGGYLGSDVVLLAKLALTGKFYQVNKVLFFHREHETRSMINPQGAENKTQWFDASKKGTYVMIRWKRFTENVRMLISDEHMTGQEKMQSFIDLLRVINWNKKLYLSELTRNLGIFLRLGR